jgi:hypothetical protein
VDTMSVRAKRGGPRGRKSGRSWQAWEQAPPGLRRWWAAADRSDHRRQRGRHHDVGGDPRRCPADPDAVGAAAYPARQAPRRQGVRQPREPELPAAAWDPATDRPAWGRALDSAWAPPLAGGAVAVMVELLAAAAGAVGPRFWAVVRVRAAGLRGRLFQPALTSRGSDTTAQPQPSCRDRPSSP